MFFYDKSRQFDAFGVDYGFRTQIWGRLRQDSSGSYPRDLLSIVENIVENIYRQGEKMLFADPLSRVCGPTEGWYDPSLPRKLAALFEHLPKEVRNNVNVRVYAGKDTCNLPIRVCVRK